MRIGIFGGTFDPVHTGHLAIAEQARESFQLDYVLFVPAGDPPHKDQEITTARHRVRMLELAIADNPYFLLSQMEIEKGDISYSYESMLLWKEAFPTDELFFLIGSDSLMSIESWYRYEDFLEMTHLIVHYRNEEPTEFFAMVDKLRKRGYEIEVLNRYAFDISSTAIREDIYHNRSIKYIVPEDVIRYLHLNNLYVKKRRS